MKEFARNPERVFEKARECRYYLVQMVDFERVMDTEKFLFSLSAFLSAFRTTTYRLYGVVEFQVGKAAKQSLKDYVHAHPSIGFLISRGNTETHGDGAVVFQRYMVSVEDSLAGDSCSRWERGTDRWRSRFESRQLATIVKKVPVDWQFQERPENLIALCHDALNEMEVIIRQALYGPQAGVTTAALGIAPKSAVPIP